MNARRRAAALAQHRDLYAEGRARGRRARLVVSLVLWGCALLGLLVMVYGALTGCTPAALILQREARSYVLQADELEARARGADRAAAHACHVAAADAEGAAYAGYPDVSPTAAQAAGRMRAACAVLRYLSQDGGGASSPPASVPDLGEPARDQAPQPPADGGPQHVG